MRKKLFRLHANVQKRVDKLNSAEQLELFDKIFEKNINLNSFSDSMKLRRIESLIDIILSNKENHEELYNTYWKTLSVSEKVKIRHGNDFHDNYKNKLKNRPRPKQPTSQFTVDFWTHRGFSVEDAKKKISEIQSRISKKRKTKLTSKNFKISLDYWTQRGYSNEEAQILRRPYLAKCKNDLESLVVKHGTEKGTELYYKRILNYKKSIKKNLENRRTAGYVSRESLRFFLPIYKFCRKNGFDRNDICFGIKGSREFFIKDMSLVENGGRFYDFCIKSIKLIVEYNGTFWHPRQIENWKNPFVSFDDALIVEKHKQMLATERQFEYCVIWSDENIMNATNKIKNIIMERKCQYQKP